jgi:chromosomal replication initiator protein
MVRGEENVLAIAGALRVIQEPGERYNPLFIFGPSSAGKTHLLYALRKRFEQVYADWNVLALPAGEFLEECEQAWQNNLICEFRQQLWRLNALLIDDVHLLANRPAPLQELYHAFNRMLADAKQLVLTSREPPNKLTDFPLTLRSRFQSGLVVPLESPRERLMRDILEQKCQVAGVQTTRTAADLLCRELHNVRELDGVMHQLTEQKNGRSRQVSLGDVRTLLQTSRSRQLSIGDIARTVCQYFRVDLNKVRSASRQQALVQARQVAMYLGRELTRASLNEIGGYFGDRDHTTVMYACRKFREDLRHNPFLARAAREIRTLLRG